MPRKSKHVPYWWLSFCDPDRPKGEHFLGVVVLRARSVPEAIRRSHLLGVNPGGEVLCFDLLPSFSPDEKFVDRLLTIADIEVLQGSATNLKQLIETQPERAKELGFL